MAQNGTKRKCNDKKENKILGIMAENNSIPQFVNSDSFMADKNYVKWLSDLKKRFRVAQLKAAVKVNTEMLKFYWSLGEDICEKQKQYKWGAKVIGRLSLDLRAEFPQSEGFSRTNLYDIKRWFAFYSSQIEFVHQAGGQLQKVDYANTPMPEILLFVPWRHQTIVDRVYDACKFACLHVCMQTCFVLCHADLFFVVLSRRFRR